MEAIRIEAPLPYFDLREVVVRPLRHISGAAPIANNDAPFFIVCLAVLTAAILIVILWIALAWLGTALSLKLRRQILVPWVSLFLLAVPPMPLFVAALTLITAQKGFGSNLFLQMLTVGATGFFIVLANALLWLFIARRWTYGKLRTTALP